MASLRKDTSLTGDPLLLRVADELADEEYRASTERPGVRREAAPPPAQVVIEDRGAPYLLATILGTAAGLAAAGAVMVAFFSAQ